MRDVRIFFLILIGVYSASLQAQNDTIKKCGFQGVMNSLMINDPDFQQNLSKDSNIEYKKGLKSTGIIYTIPVVVHIIYRTAGQNISDALIHSQIERLNTDYRKLNSDTSNVSLEFQSVVADSEIEFCLAGITRKQTSIVDIGDYYTSDAYYQTSKGGQDPWDVTKYMNIWVCETPIEGLAYPPGTVGNMDGLVIQYSYFGDQGTASRKGRTTVHEVGHYLGLLHPWSDGSFSGESSPNCSLYDDIGDTPIQDFYATGCFSRISCGTKDMLENYMQYTSESCIVMFTEGQKTKMRNTLTGVRSGLIANTSACITSVSEGNNRDYSIQVSPNPSTGIFNVDFSSMLRNSDIQIRVFNSLGKMMYEQKTKNSSEKINYSIDLYDIPNGVYLLQISDGINIVSDKLILWK